MGQAATATGMHRYVVGSHTVSALQSDACSAHHSFCPAAVAGEVPGPQQHSFIAPVTAPAQLAELTLFEFIAWHVPLWYAGFAALLSKTHVEHCPGMGVRPSAAIAAFAMRMRAHEDTALTRAAWQSGADGSAALVHTAEHPCASPPTTQPLICPFEHRSNRLKRDNVITFQLAFAVTAFLEFILYGIAYGIGYAIGRLLDYAPFSFVITT